MKGDFDKNSYYFELSKGNVKFEVLLKPFCEGKKEYFSFADFDYSLYLLLIDLCDLEWPSVACIRASRHDLNVGFALTSKLVT